MIGKRIVHYFIKYTPAVMAITCAVKVVLDAYNLDSIMKVLNVLLNTFIVVGLMLIGKEVGFCWKHRLMCYTALLGYALYSVYMHIQQPIYSEIIRIIFISYAIFVILLLIILLKCR